MLWGFTFADNLLTASFGLILSLFGIMFSVGVVGLFESTDFVAFFVFFIAGHLRTQTLKIESGAPGGAK